MLDNPIWSALTTGQAHFALGDGRARRYPADMAPFMAVERAGAEYAAALTELAEPGETLYLAGVVPGMLPGWTVEGVDSVSQMICERRANPPASDEGLSALRPRDVPDMLDLIALAYPGYFRRRTIEMGTYVGVRHESRLIAMAGQRFLLDGYREVSGVCTHPDFRGRGHAHRLVSWLVDATLKDGLTPILHVDADNPGARAVYESAGFVWRRDLEFHRLRREA